MRESDRRVMGLAQLHELIDRWLPTARKHQVRAIECALAIANGVFTKKVLTAFVVPGGGKSRMASYVAHILFHLGIIKRVLIIAPRVSLVAQMVESFHNHDLHLGLRVAPWKPGRRRRRHGRSESLIDVGFVTTIQAVVADPSSFLKYVQEEPTLVVIDEHHHMAEDKKWWDEAQPIVNGGRVVLAMSGTPYRHDGKPIPFLATDEDGRVVADINYTIQDAIRDRALRMPEFSMHCGEATWEAAGREISAKLSEVKKRKARQALWTCLIKKGFRDEIVDVMIRDLIEYRRVYANAQGIIIAPNQIIAEGIASYVAETHGLRVALAIEKQGTGATKAIRSFRQGTSDVMVTVEMAHEGLDAPSCTHMCILTNKRSDPWLRQAIARAMRFDHRCGLPWDKQRAFLWVPKDEMMQEFVRWLLEEGVAVLRPEKDVVSSRSGGGGARVPSYRAVAAELGERSLADGNVIMTTSETKLIDRLLAERPTLRKAGVQLSDLLFFAKLKFGEAVL